MTRRQVAWLIVGVVLAASLAFFLRAAVSVSRHTDSALAAVGRLRAMPASAGAGLTFAAAAVELRQMEADLRAVAKEGWPLLALAPALGWAPVYGGDLAATPALLEIASSLVSVANQGMTLLEPLLAPAGAAAEESALVQQLLRALQSHPQELAQMAGEIDRAVELRRSVAVERLSPQMRQYVTALDAWLPAMQSLARLAPRLPALLGVGRQRTYLLLAQNNEELRATGGFISGVGELALRDGAIASARFMDSYAVDDLARAHPAAPPALARHMGADYLVLRDANWTPDFPTSAQVIAGMYQLDQGVSVDGVIAWDLPAVGLLVDALGPLQVEGYAEPVSSANYMQLLMQYWEAPAESVAGGSGSAEWWAHRKDFMGALLDAALQRLVVAPASIDWPGLAWGLQTALDEKHLLIWLADPTEEALWPAHWRGALSAVAGDYLLVVDSNVGYNKVNALIDQRMDYHVWLTERPRAELRITYRHQGSVPLADCTHEARYGASYADLRQRCYWDYVRIYLPAGVAVGQVSGFVAGSEDPPAVEGDKTVVAGLLLLPPGGEQVVQITYDLPAGIYRDGVYRLDMQRQAGAQVVPFQVVVEDAACARHWETDGDVGIAGAALTWRADLRSDSQLRAGCR